MWSPKHSRNTHSSHIHANLQNALQHQANRNAMPGANHLRSIPYIIPVASRGGVACLKRVPWLGRAVPARSTVRSEGFFLHGPRNNNNNNNNNKREQQESRVELSRSTRACCHSPPLTPTHSLPLTHHSLTHSHSLPLTHSLTRTDWLTD